MSRLRRITRGLFAAACWAALLLTVPAFGAGPANAQAVGAVTETAGEARILRGADYLAVAIGVEVEAQDLLETEADAFIQIDLDDGSILKLGPRSRLHLADYQLQQDRSVLSAAVDVARGWLRFLVAKLHSARRFDINTSTILIGVRGTEGIVESDSEHAALHLLEGQIEAVGRDDEDQSRAPIVVVAGEYIERRRGQSFHKQTGAPPAFGERLPRDMRQPLARRLHALEQRGVAPRVIRRITPAEVERLVETHPTLRDRFESRPDQTPKGLESDAAQTATAANAQDAKPEPKRRPPRRHRRRTQP